LVGSESASGTKPQGQRSGFLGRESELDVLQTAFDQARNGRGGLILIGGEPGIGKTRLADEFTRRPHQAGTQVRVLWGKCWEGAGAPPYWPWIQALRGFLREIDPARARELLGSGARDLAQMLPEINSLLQDPPAAPPDSESARFQLFDSTATFLRRIGETADTVVVIDDLHAADTPSILLLRFLATQLNDMPLLVVGTYRDVAVAPDHPLFGALLELEREPITRVLTLKGLRPEVIGDFIEMTTGEIAADPLAREMWRETNGNPLFLGEAVRLLVSEKRFADLSIGGRLRLSVPAGAREVIIRRLSQLSPDTIAALTVGATLGPEFSVEILRAVRAEPRQRTLDLIDEAVRAALVEPVPTALNSFRFSHDLVRESLYDNQSPVARAHLHLQIAEAIETVYAAAIDDRLAALTYHYIEALQGAESDESRQIALKALDYAQRAATVASAGRAYEEAARVLRTAMVALDLTGDRRDDVRGQMLLEIGEAESRTGDLEVAQREFLAAAEIFRSSGDRRNLAVAALGYSGRVPWARPGSNSRIVPLLEEALGLLGEGDMRLRARLMTRLACALRSSPEQRQRSDDLSREALEVARKLGDSPTLGYAIVGRYYATFWPENHKERSILAREAFAVAEETGDPELAIDARVLLWLSQSDSPHHDAYRYNLEQLNRLAQDLRQPARLWLGITPRAMTELMEGNFDLAAELIDIELESHFLVSTVRDDVSAGHMHEFLLARERGGLVRVEAGTRFAVEEFPWYPSHRVALVLLLYETGRIEEAREIFVGLAEESFRAIYRDNEWLMGISMASEACYLLDDDKAAAVLYEQLAPFSGRHAIAHVEGSVGAVDRYLGLLSLTLGNTNRAIAHLRAAVEMNTELLARPWVARAMVDLAIALERRGTPSDSDQAAGLRAEALETAQALGMTTLIGQLRPDPDLADPGTIRAVEPSRDQRTTSSGLFRLEGDYWTIEFGTDAFRLRDAKGLRYLARLLASPGHEMLALDLAREGTGMARPAEATAEADLNSNPLGDAGPALDATAKHAYRQRVDELRAEMDQAESWNDPERASRAQEEIEFLTRELAAAVGLGGRDRSTASPSERARVSVTRAIRLALARVAENSRALGAHLDVTIRTGTYCSYTPDPRLPMVWRS